MIEWLTGIAITSLYFAYKQYTSNEEIKSLINDLEKDIVSAYNDIFIIERNYKNYFNAKKLSDWSIKHEGTIKKIKSIQPEKLENLFSEYKELKTIIKILENQKDYRKTYNDIFIQNEKEKYQKYFDNMLDVKLTNEQRECIVKDEDVNYINAGAGTGKTTTILAKIKYLVEKKNVNEDKILLLVYNTTVSKDINERLNKMGLNNVIAKTFHSFCWGLVKDSYIKKGNRFPEVFKRSEPRNGLKYLDVLFKKLEKSHKEKLTRYFLYYLKDYKPDSDFKDEKEYNEYNLINSPITIIGESVKSHEELLVANTLFKWGVKYQYEKDYEHELPDLSKKKYQPDFYLTDYGIYLEHFALNRSVDENGNNIFKEFFPGYLNNYYEKRKIHKNYKTKLIETYSQDIKDGNFQSNLKKQLIDNGVKINERSSDEILKQIKETSDFTITLFTNFLQIFLCHFKSHNSKISYLRNSVNKIYKSKYSQMRTEAFLDLFEDFYLEYERMLKSKKSEIEGVCGYVYKKESSRFDSRKFAKDNPELFKKYSIPSISGNFRLQKIKSKNSNDAIEELNDKLTSLDKQSKGELILRTSKIEELHHDWLTLISRLQPLELEKDALINRLKIICGVHSGIKNICSWKRTKSQKLSKNDLKDLDDEILSQYIIPIKANYSFSIRAYRPYKFQ